LGLLGEGIERLIFLSSSASSPASASASALALCISFHYAARDILLHLTAKEVKDNRCVRFSNAKSAGPESH
jgi:hypothetical protein